MAASDRTARPKAAFVYMVRCTGGQLYTGWTNDPAARLRAHRSGSFFSGSMAMTYLTKSRSPNGTRASRLLTLIERSARRTSYIYSSRMRFWLSVWKAAALGA